MGLLNGAVNGMMSRLVSVGFAPDEAFSLAEVAYIKAEKRDQSVPPSLVSRSDATWEIDRALSQLASSPMGPEAHRTRIRLWERIFGFGSWPEPVNPTEVYTPLELLAHGYREPDKASKSEDGGRAPAEDDSKVDTPDVEQLISGALRYLENWPCDREDVTFLPASFFKQSRESKQRWEGLLIFTPGVCGFFEYSDCRAPSISDGSPLLFSHDELEECNFWLQPELLPYAKHGRVKVWPSPDRDVYVQLKRKGKEPGSFLFAFGEWPPETHEPLRDRFAEIIAGVSFAFSMSEAGQGS
ncbi:hypothetical protein [Arthrobacter sp. UNC362MFTsu5.1]|uniref:hypothetical protein n=1 Tax=Arthrobacter sp. UNC362MFTsu5.1 TaxID=1449044 RepID=UPI0012DEB351|nr:hypothetical protein [Arthrobacter sp. UNC362MFTsu5.1]